MFRSFQSVRSSALVRRVGSLRRFSAAAAASAPAATSLTRYGTMGVGAAIGIAATIFACSGRDEAAESRSEIRRLKRELKEMKEEFEEEMENRKAKAKTKATPKAQKAIDGALAVAAPVAAPVAVTATPIVRSSPVESSPAASSSPSSTATSIPATSSPSAPSVVTMTPDEEDAEFEAWKASMETGYSAEPNPDTGRPFIRNLVAAEIPELIDARKGDVLLEIYAPWCGACKMLAPVLDSVAQVMHEVDETNPEGKPLSVFIMDGDANMAPGFLSEEENRSLPLVKFFPACGSKLVGSSDVRSLAGCQPSVYPGRPNVESMINFIHEARSKAVEVDINDSSKPATPAKVFDINKAHQLASSIEPHTHKAVEAALVRRFEADAAEMPALKLHEIAPCGDVLNKLMRRFMLSGYTSYTPSSLDEVEGQKLFGEYRSCTDREEKKLEEFWTAVKKQTEEAFETIENKKKAREAEKAQQTTEPPAATLTEPSNNAA